MKIKIKSRKHWKNKKERSSRNGPKHILEMGLLWLRVGVGAFEACFRGWNGPNQTFEPIIRAYVDILVSRDGN